MNHILLAPREFLLELRDERIAVLAIQFVERLARDDGDARRDQPNGEQHREREDPEKFGAKRHGASSSQTSASGQFSPAAGAFQSRTRVLRP